MTHWVDMNNWQQAYETGAFRITTDEPSLVVRDYAGLIPADTRALDLGCPSGMLLWTRVWFTPAM